MKRHQSAFCCILILAALLCCVTMPLRANAQAGSEIRTVTVQIHVQSGADVAKNEYVAVTFENTATGETHNFTIKTNTSGIPLEFPKGTYRVAKATLADRPAVAFETSISKLVVDDSDNIFFTLALKSVITTEENEDTVKDAITDFEQDKMNDLLLAVGMLLWLVLGVVALVYALRAKFTKDALKSDFLRAKGKITRHVFFALFCGAILGFLFGDAGGFSWFGGVFGFGFPFGAVAVSVFAPRSDAAQRDYERERTSSGFLFFLLLMLALVVGIFLTPVVIVRDITEIVKSYRNYKNRIY